ncbi:MAG: tetratricopeptide repeat protein [Chitinophagaceae bacterium]|nr:tetratricopeptide repeat protein [Chitinophagaceae bacterium]
MLFPCMLQAQQADSLAATVYTKIPDTSKIVNLSLALNLYAANDIDKAAQMAHMADSIAKLVPQVFYQGRAVLMQGLVLYFRNDAEAAIAAFTKALRLFEQSGNVFYQGRTLNNIASAYRLREKPKETEIFYLKALQLFRQVKQEDWIANVAFNLGIVQIDLKELDSAETHIKTAYQYFSKTNNETFIVRCLNELGNIRLLQKEYKEALGFFSQAYDLLKETDDQIMLGAVASGMGETYLAMKQYAAAEKYLLNSYALFRQMEQLDYTKQVLASLTQLYEAKGDFRLAFQYQHEFIRIKDSLFNQEKDQRMLETIKKYELDIKEAQLKAQDAVIQQKKIEQILYVTGLLLLSGLVMVLLFYYRQKQASNRALAEKNEIIGKALQEKEVLLKEIHHRVKNNLQVISSLLNLQSKNIIDENALAAIRDGRDRVKSMALIHQNLYRDDDLTSVDVRDYIDKLTQSLFHSYNINKERVNLTTHIDELQLDVDVVVPLGLILNELISNALKYAFEQVENGGLLRVSLTREFDQLVLQVQDNGRGLPESLNMDKPASMGYQLIKSLTQKLKATISIEGNNGTLAKMIIPYNFSS